MRCLDRKLGRGLSIVCCSRCCALEPGGSLVVSFSKGWRVKGALSLAGSANDGPDDDTESSRPRGCRALHAPGARCHHRRHRSPVRLPQGAVGPRAAQHPADPSLTAPWELRRRRLIAPPLFAALVAEIPAAHADICAVAGLFGVPAPPEPRPTSPIPPRCRAGGRTRWTRACREIGRSRVPRRQVDRPSHDAVGRTHTLATR
jgi:hypothetical protein